MSIPSPRVLRRNIFNKFRKEFGRSGGGNTSDTSEDGNGSLVVVVVEPFLIKLYSYQNYNYIHFISFIHFR